MAERPPLLALLDRVRAGDPVAVHELYREVEPLLRRVARGTLDRRTRRLADSDDVAQSAFRRMLQGSHRARFEREKDALAWMATIVRNRIRNLARRIHAPGGAAWVPLADEGLAGDGADPALLAAQAEEVVRFRLALDALPAAEREVVVLRDFEGLDFAATAERTGRPSADAARKLHDRALARLRRILEDGPPGWS